MCGIAAIVGTSPVNQRLYDALTVLQHRGQDAAGIVTVADGLVSMRKGKGLVRDVFGQQDMLELRGDIGIGHVRYPTSGCDSASEAQPFYVNAPYGLVLGHNGNLTNAAELADVLVREERRHLNTSSDSEVLLNVLASELQRVGTPRITAADVDLLIPHQANIRIIEATAKHAGIPMDKVFVNVDRFGNTSAASIPIALNDAMEQGRVKEGSTVLFAAFGAGFTWGSLVVRF